MHCLNYIVRLFWFNFILDKSGYDVGTRIDNLATNKVFSLNLISRERNESLGLKVPADQACPMPHHIFLHLLLKFRYMKSHINVT